MSLIKSCDNCGKITSDKPTYLSANDRVYTPKNWYRLENIKVLHRPQNKKNIDDKNILDIKTTDPDFCSKKCLIEWLQKELDKI